MRRKDKEDVIEKIKALESEMNTITRKHCSNVCKIPRQKLMIIICHKNKKLLFQRNEQN